MQWLYTSVFKIIAVFKKVSEAQNPYNSFFFPYVQMHWEHCTVYSKSKMFPMLLFYRKLRKRRFQKIAVFAFSFTNTNIDCIN